MAILSKEQILAASDLKRVTVAMPEWGGEVILQEMTLEQRLSFEQALDPEGNNMRCAIVAFCAVNEAGELLFTLEDVQALAKKNGKAIIRLSSKAIRLNRVQEREIEAEKENF
jgi:hypothetical protein